MSRLVSALVLLAYGFLGFAIALAYGSLGGLLVAGIFTASGAHLWAEYWRRNITIKRGRRPWE